MILTTKSYKDLTKMNNAELMSNAVGKQKVLYEDIPFKAVGTYPLNDSISNYDFILIEHGRGTVDKINYLQTWIGKSLDLLERGSSKSNMVFHGNGSINSYVVFYFNDNNLIISESATSDVHYEFITKITGIKLGQLNIKRIEDTLWEGNVREIGSTGNLLHSLTDYDELQVITHWAPVSSPRDGIILQCNLNVNELSNMINTLPNAIHAFVHVFDTYYFGLHFTNNSFSINSGLLWRESDVQYIKKIIGIKYEQDYSSRYSLDEKKIGKWIDGKPLYRKTVNFGILPNANSNICAHGITDVDIIWIDIGDSYVTNGSDYMPIEYPSSNLSSQYFFLVDPTNIRCWAGSDRRSYNALVTVCYTKTTDVADS